MPLSHYMGINWFLTSINLWSHNTLQRTVWYLSITVHSVIGRKYITAHQRRVIRWIFRFGASSHSTLSGFNSLRERNPMPAVRFVNDKKNFLHCQWVHIWSLFKSDSVEWKIQGWIIGSCLVPPSAQKIFLRLHLCIVASMINLNFSFVASDNRSMVVHKQKSFNRRNSTKEMWEVPVSGTSSGFRSMTRCSIISRIWWKLLWIKLIPPQRGESHSGEK